MPRDPSLKGLERKQIGPRKTCTRIKDGRQEQPRNNKRLETELEKPHDQNPKRAKQGGTPPCKRNMKIKDTVKSTYFEILKLFLKQKVPLNRMLVLCPRFKAKVLSKGMHDLNEELEMTNKGIACNMVQPVDLPKV